MIGDLPLPPYPPDTRAKGWRFEIDYEQIEQSETWPLAAEVPMAQHALLMMWLVAWQQVPCGSFPDDEQVIRAKCRIPAATWPKLRDVLLRGWQKASDGRLYHPTITQRVMEMMRRRRSDSDRQAAKRAREAAESRQDHGNVTRDKTVIHGGVGAESSTDNRPPNTSSLRSEVPRAARGGYTAEFEEAWACYPKRAGGNSKGDAFKAWSARIRDGATAEAMTTGVVRYAAFCRATGKLGTEFVKQAATFFGPAQHFAENWALPTIQPAGGGQPSALARGLTALAPMVARRDRGQVVEGLTVEAGHG